MDILVQACGYFNTHTYESLNGTLPRPNKEDLLSKRKKLIGSKCQIFYQDDPFVVTKASMQYLYDESGRRFIDCISNVQNVGHCHPTVVEEISKQLATATCNVRFVSPKLTECAEEILKTLPGLDVVLFCNSGSEANDLALRLARDFTNKNDVIVLDHAYHGHVTTTMQMSPYKFDHGSSLEKPDWVHVAPVPDTYRGRYRLSDEDLSNETQLIEAGKLYADEVLNIINHMINGFNTQLLIDASYRKVQAESQGRSVCSYIAEALQSCGGQIIPPKGYLLNVAQHIHDHGGVMILDEVQTGFGRIGEAFWAHKLYNDGFVPDIVTMGKPMGNGFPVSAVVTRKEIADTLGGGVGYFNTYGGNPVACAAVLGVMKVIKDENLLDHVEDMGLRFEKELNKLKAKHECIGDVRGVGMFWGLDLVTDRISREPATQLANKLIMLLRQEYGVLLSTDGPYSNILKFKPPLCFNKKDLKMAVEALDKALISLTARRTSIR